MDDGIAHAPGACPMNEELEGIVEVEGDNVESMSILQRSDLYARSAVRRKYRITKDLK